MVVTLSKDPGRVDSAGVGPRRVVARAEGGDRAFLGITRISGLLVVAVITAVGGFLAIRAWPALHVAGPKFLTTAAWQPDSHHFGIAGVLLGSVLIALVAVIVSTPIALATALLLSEVVPQQLRRTLISLVDLMAAVPSVVYGLWGFRYLQGHALGVARWLATWMSWIPLFKVDTAGGGTATVYTASTFIVGLVVSLMVLPIQCSIMREAFSQAPLGEREGAYALGATRWGMIREVVLPFGRGGIIGGTMLGLGRALGETIAVYLIISPTFSIQWHILHSGGNSVSALIALQSGDASGFGTSALMAAGLTLFILTLIVNFSASAIVSRSRSGAQSDG